jgi:hypothetical protein
MLGYSIRRDTFQFEKIDSSPTLNLNACACHNYYYSLLLTSIRYMEKNNNSSSCDARVHAYKNGKTMEQCKEQARKNTELLLEEILKKGEVSWARILEVTDYDELVYKLTLKYLRQKGYDIGNNKIPRVKANTTIIS